MLYHAAVRNLKLAREAMSNLPPSEYVCGAVPLPLFVSEAKCEGSKVTAAPSRRLEKIPARTLRHAMSRDERAPIYICIAVHAGDLAFGIVKTHQLGKNLLPGGCQFLMPDCSAIPGESQQYAVNWMAAHVFRCTWRAPSKDPKAG
jgi:hypothetical protein